MVWGLIGSEGPLKLVRVEENLNAESYIEILRNDLLNIEGIQDHIFMQDQAPCHRATKTRKFFEQEDIELMEWPGNAPDMNPIENIWAWLKDEIYKHRATLNSKDRIWNFARRRFFSEECEILCKKCLASVPERLKKVIDK
jgi:transposase